MTFRRTGDPILSLSNPRGITRQMQRQSLDALKALNEHHLELTGDPKSPRASTHSKCLSNAGERPRVDEFIEGIKNDAGNVRRRTRKSSYANNCLLARRLIERGVRFVQLFHEAWDHHSDVANGVKSQLKNTDQATTALILDLKQRGLLEDTIVIWAANSGRTPMVETDADAGRSKGRDHHNKAFTMFVAGGGFKPGITIGKTDDLGFNVVEDPVQVHDLHATGIATARFLITRS